MDRIDSKDKPGAYRTAIFEEVQQVLKFKGEAPASQNVFLGDWVCRLVNLSSPDVSRLWSHTSFYPDGNASSKGADGRRTSLKDRWKFNSDHSFSLWIYSDPMPEYGLNEPTYTEERYHVLMKSADEFILFNGDASLVFIYSRVRK